jgi:predicted methyltransferase
VDPTCVLVASDDRGVLEHTGVVDDEGAHIESAERGEEIVEPVGLASGDDHRCHVVAPDATVRDRCERGDSRTERSLALGTL